MYGWPHSNYQNLAASNQEEQKYQRGDSKDHDSNGTSGTNNSQRSHEADNTQTKEVVMDMYNNVISDSQPQKQPKMNQKQF